MTSTGCGDYWIYDTTWSEDTEQRYPIEAYGTIRYQECLLDSGLSDFRSKSIITFPLFDERHCVTVASVERIKERRKYSI